MDNLARAQVLISQHHYEQAVEFLKKELAFDPNNAGAVAYLALCYLHMDMADKAITTAKQSLALQPNSDFAFFIMALAHLNKSEFRKAEAAIDQAITFNPFEADYYGAKAQLKLATRDFNDAKVLAQKGLEVNPESLFCRNMLSTALLKLGSKEESFNVIERALELDPENSVTHANYGWAQLEKGSHKKALEHFKEALKRDPEDEYARAGMLESLKAKYILYRAFLKYYFFMANLKPGIQWIVILGILFLNRILRAILNSAPELAIILIPLMILLVFFVLSTWVIQPVFNFIISLNRYGRYLLDDDTKNIAKAVGVCFAVFLLSIVGWLFTRDDGFLASAIVGYTLILPVGRILDSSKPWVRWVTGIYSAVAAFFGGLFIWRSFDYKMGFENEYLMYYALMIIAFSWLWNFIANR